MPGIKSWINPRFNEDDMTVLLIKSTGALDSGKELFL
jgi:hypothetical protein